MNHIAGCVCSKCTFLKKKINPHGNQESTSAIANHFLIFEQPRDPFRKYIAEYNQYNITQPYAGNKTEAAFMAYCNTLFNDGENDRADRQCKHNPKC